MNPRVQPLPGRGAQTSRYGGNYTPGYTGVPRLRRGAAPRLASMRQPENGFAISNQRFAGIPQNDPYAQHSQAMDQEKLWQVLTTEAGRQAIGAQMAVPIRTELDYQGVIRRFFELDPLAQGQIARYDKDISVPAYAVGRRGQVQQWTVEGEYVEPTTWELFSPASVRLSEIQRRRFNILDRTKEKIQIGLQIQEDDEGLALLDTTAAGNIANNSIISGGASGCSKDFLNRLTAEIMDKDLPCYGLLMRFSSYKDIRDWGSTDLDPVTMREILNTGLRGTLWGIDIVVSRRVTEGRVYALSEPRFLGVMPIRTDVIVLPDDVPKLAEIGYVGYEEVGMVIPNANGVALGTHTVL